MGGGVRLPRRRLIRRAAGCGVGGLETGHPGAELSVLIPEFPVRLGQPLEPLGGPARPEDSRDGKQESGGRDQPVKCQQTSYLIERLATVSTA
jgi:hypothetical protein